MIQRVRKAVFPVAGFGTRFLPVTKAMPKELLPIIDKPLIQYAVEEAIAAGIDTLIFVTGRHKRAVEDHFDSNPELEKALRSRGRYAEADMVRNILPDGVECIFVRQQEQLGLGHAVLCAERAVGSDPFAVLLADDFLTYKGDGVTAELVSAFERTGKAQLSVMEVDGPEITKYGVVKPGDTPGQVLGLVEKPAYEVAPSNLACIGRYVLTAEIFDVLQGQEPGVGNEIQLTDAINTLSFQGKVLSKIMNANRFDCGSIEGYLDAMMTEVAKRIKCIRT